MPARLDPLPLDEYRSVRRAYLDPDERPDDAVLNIERTWAHHPQLWVAQHHFAMYRDNGCTLTPAERELVVLRTAARCGSGYVVAQHAPRFVATGRGEAEVEHILRDPPGAGLSATDLLLLRAVDDLCERHALSDQTWAELAETRNTKEILDLLALVGRYWSVSVTARSLGVPLEPGRPDRLAQRGGPE